VSSLDVIVPCYRYGHFLTECVASVLNQNGPSVRVLIIDDASPDETRTIGPKLAERDQRVTYRRHIENQGHIATYNEGIAWVAADYLLLLSADDYLLPCALERSVALMDRYPGMAFVFGNALRMDEHGAKTPIRTIKTKADHRLLAGRDFIRLSRASNLVPTPTAVVRSSFQRRVGGYRLELPHSGDQEMWLRLAANGSVGMINSYQAVYRRHTSNMSLDYMTNSFLPEIRQRKAALDYFFADYSHLVSDSAVLRKRSYRSLSRSALGLASSAFGDGQTAIAENLSTFALAMDPGVRFSSSWVKFIWRKHLSAVARRASTIIREES